MRYASLDEQRRTWSKADVMLAEETPALIFELAETLGRLANDGTDEILLEFFAGMDAEQCRNVAFFAAIAFADSLMRLEGGEAAVNN